MSAATADADREIVDANPFDLTCAPSGHAALCLHGLTGTPYEVRPIADALVARGVRAQGLLLPGHGTSPQELAKTPRTAWLDAVRDAYRMLRAQNERVYVVGVSLGGLLALRLAQLEPVDGIVSIGTPLALNPPLPWLVPVAKLLVRQIPKSGSDIRDPAARARHPGYRSMPLAAVHELIRLQAEVCAQLGEITAPMLVAHGSHDQTANPRDAQRIHREIKSAEKEVQIYQRSGHVVPVDYDGPELAQRAAAFLTGLGGSALDSSSEAGE